MVICVVLLIDETFYCAHYVGVIGRLAKDISERKIGMLKRITTAFLTAAMLFGTTVFADVQTNDKENTISEPGSIKFDFIKDDCGFTPIFADYPIGDNVDDFYELDFGWRDIPIDSAGKGLFISGNNHSDDLFMGYYKKLSGFAPGKTFTVNLSFELATNADGGMIGIGGSPGSSVYVKCGITSQEPAAVEAEYGHRLNIDKGNQGTDGKDMKIAGTIEKHETLFPGQYEFNGYRATVEMTADRTGNAYLIIGTDSGFEGITSYYVSNIELQWAEKDENTYDEQVEQAIKEATAVGILENKDYDWNEDISRLQFCEFAYNMLSSVQDLPVAKLSRNPFDDIDNFKINTLAFMGIISGRDEYLFVPEDKITREEAAVVLYRIAQYAKIEIPAVRVDMSYSDNDAISEWAIAPVYSMKTLNVITNSNGELFNPKASYTLRESLYSLMKVYHFIKK